MKYYELKAIINGQIIKLKKDRFASRTEAINYMFQYFEDHYLYGLDVSEEYPVNNDKHSIEYVCDYYNRFQVTRQVQA